MRQRSAMYFTVPLFLAFGVVVFFVLPAPTTPTPRGGANWPLINMAIMVAGGAALAGSAVGWMLDWIARAK